MAIKIKKVNFPPISKNIKRAMHQAYYHTSLLSNFEVDHPSILLKETPLLRWYKCQKCGEIWKEHRYEGT
jgi:hypothetical protein